MILALALAALAVTNLDGARVDPFAGAPRAVAFVFIHTDCPMSNRYAPELNRLHAEYAKRGVAFYLVYPGREEELPALRAHHAEYGLKAPALYDPEFQLADRARATMTPEAALFDGSGRLVYHGRIDDRAVRLSVFRPVARTRDLAAALDRVLAGERVPFHSTQAVGCYIKPLS